MGLPLTAIRETVYGPDHPSVTITLAKLAHLLETVSRYEEAEPLYLRSLAITEAVYGPDHPEVAVILCNLTNLLETLSRYDEATILRARVSQDQF